jgi:hypothetical protein
MNQTELSEAAAGVQQRVAGLSRQSLLHQPAPGKWSRQQVLQHLMIAYQGTARDLQRRLDADKPTQRRPSLKQRAAQFWLLRVGKFPSGFEAPEFVRPEKLVLPPMEGDALATAYGDEIKALQAKIDASADRWGTEKRIAVHPVIGPLSAAQWTAFHALHTRHHIGQLDRISAQVKV